MRTLWMQVAETPRAPAVSPMPPAQALDDADLRHDEQPDFATRRLPDGQVLAVSASGDHIFTSAPELALLLEHPEQLPLLRRAELQGKYFLPSLTNRQGTARLLRSRQAARSETVSGGPSLHIIVPTLQCAHTCRYCQVSRSLTDVGHTMSIPDLDAACDSIFESKADALTVEFQGGDPLLRFDLVRHAIQRISTRNAIAQRRIRFVVASTLHQLDAEMCSFFRTHGVYLSTSIDGPSWLHNKNRPLATRNSHEQTLRGVSLAREAIGHDAVSALMTTTRESLSHPEAIVDEYVRLGFNDIFLRPLSAYGFAKRNQAALAYTLDDFIDFHQRALERVLYWNREGVRIREVYTSILLNKILSSFDCGYVDLQSPTGAGAGVLVNNYDGYVYPSDEARMLAESGNTSLRMGRIGEPIDLLVKSLVRTRLVASSTATKFADCRGCAYKTYCAPNPVDALAQHGRFDVEPADTEHCQRHTALFDATFMRLKRADAWTLDLFHAWARSNEHQEAA